MHTKITHCRICGNPKLTEILSLGDQMLTGVFPKSRDERASVGPLTLVKCEVSGPDQCGLVQLAHSYDLSELYGLNYGYRSGLNKSMVIHLHDKIRSILSVAKLEKGDLIIDIGSNDSTSLQAYPTKDYLLVGIDPTGGKFKDYYPAHIRLIPDFFSIAKVRKQFGEKKAKVITSFSMFYDLEEPMKFMKEVHDCLAEDGVWVFEQSYLPMMLETNSYDTVCHEHLEYYALSQVKWMADRVGFKIVAIEMNDINGGSFSVTVAKKNAAYPEAANLGEILLSEKKLGVDGLELYRAFADRVASAKREFRDFLDRAKKEGKTVYGLGASTKGNVLLQYSGVTSTEIPYIGEVNRDKFGCYTPGTYIPIISEEEVLAKKPDYLLVLPWHFRRFFENNTKFRGTKLVFPLPKLEIVG
jgi:NDP-4-keto-2,6-dideoxyhexose 3-C-methyltransferase